MIKQPIDFHGIVDLDHKIVAQLERFLQVKENDLAQQILNIIPLSLKVRPSAPSAPGEGTNVKILEAVEGFSKKVRGLNTINVNPQSDSVPLDQILKDLHASFWAFTEILEGCVVELFQQVRQVSIDRWHISIAQVVHEIKNVLSHYIEDLIWTIRRLEKPLKEYCPKFPQKTKRSWFESLFSSRNYLDHGLLNNLYQTEKYLKTQYAAFQHHYHEFMFLNIKTEENLERMKSYPVLALLDLADQNLYVDIYRLLNMIELNQNPKKEVAVDTVKALKNLTSFDNIKHVFRTYYRGLKEALFTSSLEWKSLPRENEDFSARFERLKNKIKEYQHETHELARTMSRYRTFILKNDPNPYIRTRWGFSEWIVGPEPAKAKKMINMIYSAEELENLFKQLQAAFSRDPQVYEKEVSEARQKIEKLLHELGQPLISRSMMKNRAEALLEELKVCDEIGSPDQTSLAYFEDVLSKIMREDWRYHVFHEFPLFHQIYHLHQGLAEHFDDPAHAFRVDRFELLFAQIEDWVEKDDVYAHIHEIQLDINDLKTYLQDFLAIVQRAAREKPHDPFFDDTLRKLRHQLLEYRYLFGKFFLYLMSKSSDGMQLRNQFLFVNQYFESVENLFNELKASKDKNELSQESSEQVNE